MTDRVGYILYDDRVRYAVDDYPVTEYVLGMVDRITIAWGETDG